MYQKKFTKIVILLVIAVILFTPINTTIGIQNAESLEKGQLIVHEWGTFTTLSNANGTQQYWYPLIGPSELPGFVYGRKSLSQGRCYKCGEAILARMETPV